MNDVDESYFDWSDEEDIICSSKYISSSDEEDDTSAIISAYIKLGKGRSVFGSKQSQKRKQEEEDDFEKEMASELTQTMQHLTSSLGLPGSSGTSQPTSEASKTAPEFYDDVYFDSDESDPEEGTPGRASRGTGQSHRRSRKVLTNDELFYDPTMDDRDQEWVNQKRRSYQLRGRRPGRTLGVENNNTIQLPPTDAVLNCPACLTTLCMDCQRHEIYHNQYRAMFVFNCVVDMTERLSYPKKDLKRREFLKNKKSRKNKQQVVQQEGKEAAKGEDEETGAAAAITDNTTVNAEEAHSSSNLTASASSDPPSVTKTGTSAGELGKDMFHPVMCKICNTKVAVYDSDEVYHFFNIVTSY